MNTKLVCMLDFKVSLTSSYMCSCYNFSLYLYSVSFHVQYLLTCMLWVYINV